MNITRLNFRECLPFVRQSLQASHCYSFDIEMTGILGTDVLRNSILDSFQTRYAKTKSNIETFLPVQLGICGFKQSGSAIRSHEAFPFNFYIYPFVLNNAEDRIFSFSSGSMRFLAENNFDFNKLFYEGILYVSREDKKLYEGQYRLEKIRKSLKEMDKIITPDMKAFSNLYENKIVDWLKSSSTEAFTIPIRFIKFRVYMKLLESIRKQYPNISFCDSYDSEKAFDRKLLTLTKGPIDETQKPKQQPAENDHLWLPSIIDIITQSRKPVIVHNGFLDLMHIYHKFIGRLPDTVEQYKHRLNEVFPTIYDTKYITSTSVLLYNKLNRQTNLKNCYEILEEEVEPKIELNESCREYSLSEKSGEYHEAGYDALLTGVAYLKAMHILESLSSKQNTSFADTLKFFVGRVPLGNIQFPFNFSEKEDGYKNGQTVFHVQSIICSPVKQIDIQSFFEQKFGRVNIFWTARHVFNFGVQFQNKEKEIAFANFLQQHNGIATIDISNIKFLVFSDDRYSEYLRGAAVVSPEQTDPATQP